MSTDENVQSIVDELIRMWQDEQAAPGTASEEHRNTLPFDRDIVGDGEAALSGVEPAKHKTIVAEGDSWFDYPIKGDLLDVLRNRYGYEIYEVSKAGALLEDMVYGTRRSFWSGSRPHIIDTMDEVAKRRPTVVLFSGGGNDIAGTELAAFINRRADGVDPVRVGAVDDLIFVHFRRAYEVFISAILSVGEREGFNVQILGHDYDFPNPDGRGYSVTGWIPGFSYVGPWLKPIFDQKGYSIDEGRAIIARVLKKFSELQEELSQAHAAFHTVKLQGTLMPQDTFDWDDEMHPSWQGFKALGVKVDHAIQAIP